MQTYRLEDVIPEKAEFTLGGKTYSLRLIDCDDRLWMQKHIGDRDAQLTMLKTRDWEKLSAVIYYLLEDKSDFLPLEEKDRETFQPILIQGPQRFRRALKTLEDETRVFAAFNATTANSDPIVGDYMRDQVKKKIAEIESRPAGPPSSKPSDASTASPSSNAASSPSEKSTGDSAGSTPETDPSSPSRPDSAGSSSPSPKKKSRQHQSSSPPSKRKQPQKP